MTTLLAQPAPRSAGAARIDDFKRMIAAYQQATERLKESHDLLMGEVSRLRAEVVAKNQQLERRKRLAALGEMAAGVAHEIRNPLGSILLYADLLSRQLRDEPKKGELAVKICAAVRGLDAIVNDMLTFTRAVEATCEPTNLASLVAEAAAETESRLAAAGATLDVTAIDPSMQIELDARLFKRVLTNLIANAADAMVRQPGQRRVAVTAVDLAQPPLAANGPRIELPSSRPARWQITVSDTGPGIKPEVIEKVFHPFFTTKDHGTGLGLAIVHHIVDAHGGVITAGNGERSGAIFSVLLP